MASPKHKKYKAGEPAPQGGGEIESVAPDAGGHRSTERKLGRREVIAIIGGLALAMFLAALNQTIVATALPTIGRAFGDFENLSWVVIAYLLTSTVVAPLYGKLSDIYGRRGMMLVALGIFMAGSAACAMAPSMLMLILGRGLQGIGGGGIVPLTQSIIADAVPPRERGHYQAYTGSVWIVAGAAGPVLGGFIAEHLHWSMIFWLNVPLALAAAMLSNRQLKRLPRHDRRHKLDVLGAGLMMVAAIALMLALTWGGTRYGWLSPEIIGLFVASAVLSVVFVWWVMRVPEPFLPLTVLNNPVMRIGVIASSCTQGVSIGLTIFVPLYYELVHRLSASDSGLALIPIVMMTTPGSFMSGRAMLYMRHYKWVPIVMLSIDADGGRIAGDLSADAGMGGRRGDVPGRARHRQLVPDRHRVDPERGGAPADRRRHGRDEFLPGAGQRARGRDHGRDHAGRSRRLAATRRRVVVGVHCDRGKCLARRSRARLQPYFCGGGGFPDHRRRGADDHGRAAVANHRARSPGSARDAAAGAGGVAPSGAAA